MLRSAIALRCCGSGNSVLTAAAISCSRNRLGFAPPFPPPSLFTSAFSSVSSAPTNPNPNPSSLSATENSAEFLSSLRLLRMPSLSPTMKSGILRKLYLKEGASISSYDLGLEISTLGLTKTETEEESVMDIEVIEDMHVAKIYCKEGEDLLVDSPIAILCDSLQDVASVKSRLESKALLLEHLYPAMWQAYTKSKDDSGNCGC